MQDKDLDDLFAQARALRHDQPSAQLMARVLQDAAAEQPRAAQHMQVIRPKLGFWSRLALALGGKPAFAGMAFAAILGVSLGYMAPAEVLGGFSAAYAGELELIPVAEPFFEESFE